MTLTSMPTRRALILTSLFKMSFLCLAAWLGSMDTRRWWRSGVRNSVVSKGRTCCLGLTRICFQISNLASDPITLAFPVAYGGSVMLHLFSDSVIVSVAGLLARIVKIDGM